MSTYQIDQIDQKILSFLVKNARMPFLEIARECNVSGAAIHQRVKRLEANGVITGSRLLVKPQALGLNVCAFVSVSLSEANKYPEVIEAFKKNDDVEAVRTVFITKEDFNYRALSDLAMKAKKITDAVHSTLQLDELDCASCKMKPVCDEVEGLRELHFKKEKEKR